MKRNQGRYWFASLRRDGKLFAFVAGLALLLAMLQPVVPAQAALDDAGVICTAHANGVDTGAPSEHRDCPCCVFGHLCGGLPLLAKALTADFPAFGFPASQRHTVIELRTPPVGQRLAAGPPGIRAPPFL